MIKKFNGKFLGGIYFILIKKFCTHKLGFKRVLLTNENKSFAYSTRIFHNFD